MFDAVVRAARMVWADLVERDLCASDMKRAAKTRSPKRLAEKAPPLNRDDWMKAGQAVLCEKGIAGMRLAELTTRLQVSTGSFYHHFVDMGDYLGALASYYNIEQVQRLAQRLTEEFPDPAERIRQLAVQSIRSKLFVLDAAMRVWAASDKRAAKSVRNAENIVRVFLSDAFREFGFTEAEALLRADIVIAVNITQLLANDAARHKRLREDTLQLLLRRP